MPGKLNNYQKKNKRSNGQSLVEFALVLPILLLLILGAMDLGRMFYIKVVLTNAAREGANHLANFKRDDDAGALLAIKNEASSSNVEVVDSEVTISSLREPGEPVEVSITKEVDLIFDGILQSLGLIGGPLQLTSAIQMVVQ